MNIPPYLQRQLNGYQRAVQVRNYLLRPLAQIATQFSISPLMVSIGGLGMMGVLALLLPRHPWLAVTGGALSVFLDALDGVLARYQGRASDRGKFIDLTFDSVVFTLFVVGLVHAGFLPGVMGIGLVSTMGLSRIFRIMLHARYLPSDWHFRAVAGFLPIAASFILYALLPLTIMSGLSLLPLMSLFTSFILLIDATAHFKQLLDS